MFKTTSGGKSGGAFINMTLPGMDSDQKGDLSSPEPYVSEDEVVDISTNQPIAKKTKGRVKIKMEFIRNKLRRYTTFSKRKTGIMKKAYELSTLTGTQVMLLVASETGHVYTFATRKLQPMITSDNGKSLIQMCLNSPDHEGQSPNVGGPGVGMSAVGEEDLDQRMNPNGFQETELSYQVPDDDSKNSNDELDLSELCGDGGLQGAEVLLAHEHQHQQQQQQHQQQQQQQPARKRPRPQQSQPQHRQAAQQLQGDSSLPAKREASAGAMYGLQGQISNGTAGATTHVTMTTSAGSPTETEANQTVPTSVVFSIGQEQLTQGGMGKSNLTQLQPAVTVSGAGQIAGFSNLAQFSGGLGVTPQTVQTNGAQQIFNFPHMAVLPGNNSAPPGLVAGAGGVANAALAATTQNISVVGGTAAPVMYQQAAAAAAVAQMSNSQGMVYAHPDGNLLYFNQPQGFTAALPSQDQSGNPQGIPIIMPLSQVFSTMNASAVPSADNSVSRGDNSTKK